MNPRQALHANVRVVVLVVMFTLSTHVRSPTGEVRTVRDLLATADTTPGIENRRRTAEATRWSESCQQATRAWLVENEPTVCSGSAYGEPVTCIGQRIRAAAWATTLEMVKDTERRG